MSKKVFEDDCPGCRPVIIDLQGRPVPANDPVVKAVNRVWAETTREEREAFHRVTCLNSRAFTDLTIMQKLTKRIEEAANTTVH